MSFTVKGYSLEVINLAPATIEEEVLQNIAVILSTPQFSVPFDRGFGLSRRFVDKPLRAAESILVSEIYDAIEKYEPRAEIIDISFEYGDEKPGRLIPVLEVEIK